VDRGLLFKIPVLIFLLDGRADELTAHRTVLLGTSNGIMISIMLEECRGSLRVEAGEYQSANNSIRIF
jgi:hypothetical protein